MSSPSSNDPSLSSHNDPSKPLVHPIAPTDISTTAPILVVSAIDKEIQYSIQQAQAKLEAEWPPLCKFYRGILEKQNVILGTVGIGKAMTAMNIQRAIDTYHPCKIIFIGLAGALNPEYNIGDLVLGSDTVFYDMDATSLTFERGEIPFTKMRYLSADPQLLQLASTYTREGQALHKGRILTGDTFVTTTDRTKLHDELKGDAVEMEGASVALVAIINKIPHLIIRLISDRADGKARVDFVRFLPQASAKLFDILQYLLQKIA